MRVYISHFSGLMIILSPVL